MPACTCGAMKSSTSAASRPASRIWSISLSFLRLTDMTSESGNVCLALPAPSESRGDDGDSSAQQLVDAGLGARTGVDLLHDDRAVQMTVPGRQAAGDDN